jgi:uncharacterized C2H2 Zn-finger protein
MDDDLEAIVSIPCELEGESCSSNVDEELALCEHEDTCQDIFPYNFDIALSFIDENEETMEEEIADAVSEISGEKNFPCESCDKICKSKGGLTRHKNAKHGNKSTAEKENVASSKTSLTKEELKSIVDKVKTKIKDDAFWDSEMTSNMASITSNDSLYDNILPIYERFCRKLNQDLFLTDFYELIPNSCCLLQSENQQLCSLIMILIPDHLVSLSKGVTSDQEPAIGCTGSGQTGISSELNENERGPLSYIAGYVLSNLNKKSKNKGNGELQLILEHMISPGLENKYIEARSRGGLVTPCDDLVKLLEVVENRFRQFIGKQPSVVKSIPCDKLCNDALDLPLLKSLWDNILQACGNNISKQTNKLCLENIIKLYLKVRSFSYAKDYISKFKIQQKAKKSKGLRKELKRYSEDNK